MEKTRKNIAEEEGSLLLKKGPYINTARGVGKAAVLCEGNT